jgi:hypothetical protein
MGVFRLRKESKSWFKDIVNKNALQLDFDVYYFCLVAGLATKIKRDLPTAETSELVETFPGRYRDRSKIIIALFLARELDSLGVTLKDKKTAHNQISRLVRPDSPNCLSDEGMKELNKYAAGGFEAISSWFEDRPRSLDTFLRIFSMKIAPNVTTFSI